MKANTGSIPILADDALYMMRQSPVESTVSLTVIAPNQPRLKYCIGTHASAGGAAHQLPRELSIRVRRYRKS
jgi:hypothetical protein